MIPQAHDMPSYAYVPVVCRIQGYEDTVTVAFCLTVSGAFQKVKPRDDPRRSRCVCNRGMHRKNVPFARKSDPQIQCDSCKGKSHKAVDCVLLVRGIYILKYIQTHKKLCEDIAKYWANKNMTEKVVKIAEAYFDTLPHLNMDSISDQLDFSLKDILLGSDE